MEQAIAIPRMELLQVADAVAREKGIDRDEVLTAMEQAIQKAGRSKYGHEHDIQTLIRTAVINNIPIALNRTSADLIIMESAQEV